MTETIRPESGTGTAPVCREQFAVEEQLIVQVLRSFDGCTDPRLKQIMKSLALHLHAFLRDIRLTEEEWNKAVEFLTAVGHITDDRRQEDARLGCCNDPWKRPL